MSIEGLELYSKDQLIDELINRQTFVGVVIYHREDAKAGRLEQGEIVMTKSPPLPREGVEQFLQLGQSLVPGMFGDKAAIVGSGSAEALVRCADPPPLWLDEGGVVRVGKSRVSIDLVVQHYENGMSPEEMVRAYDSLALADVYSAIALYLKHRDEVRTYLTRRKTEADSLRVKIESERPRITRDELSTRSRPTEKDHAPAGQ